MTGREATHVTILDLPTRQCVCSNRSNQVIEGAKAGMAVTNPPLKDRLEARFSHLGSDNDLMGYLTPHSGYINHVLHRSRTVL